MRSISPDTKALIEQLNRPNGFWETLSGSRDDSTLLTAIGDADEPAAIVDIMPFTLSRMGDVAQAAAIAVHKLLRGIRSREFPWLDWAVRQRSPYPGTHAYEWYKMSPAQLDLFQRFREPWVSLLGMTSFHHDGHVRQAAIERLNLITTGAELPFLLLRLNDWVSNVRDIAYEAVHARLKPEYAPSFIANLPLVARLETAGRVDHQGLILLIDELLQSDACRPALLASLKSDDRFIRRASFALALNSSRTDLPELTRQALSDRDTVVRLWAAQTVSLAFAGGTLEQFLELMKRDRFMPVRREALRSYVRHIAERAPDELHSALLDPNPAMREEARFHLRTIAPMDVAAFYRETLSAGRDVNLYAAIGGLGETGSEVDDLLIVSYASDQTAKIRRAAIKALARLNAKAHIELFLTALTDEAPDVSRQALNAGAGMAAAIAGKKVWSIFASAPNGHIKRNAFLLLQRLPKWDSICYLLQAIRDRDEAVAGMSRMGIQRWLRRFNRSFTLPSGDQAAKIKDALAQCDELIEERTKREILFSLKTS